MPQANVNDRGTIEAIYPPDDFKRDAGQNSVGNASVLSGLAIRSQPDEAGHFDLLRAKRQSGERDPEGDTVFLPPFLKGDAPAVAPAGTPDDYAAFIDRVVEVARRVTFKTPNGQDERLAGFHGG